MAFLPLVFSIVAGAVGIVFGILFFSAVTNNVCPDPLTDPNGNHNCQTTKDMGWTVMGILPIGLFVTVYFIFRNVFDS